MPGKVGCLSTSADTVERVGNASQRRLEISQNVENYHRTVFGFKETIRMVHASYSWSNG